MQIYVNRFVEDDKNIENNDNNDNNNENNIVYEYEIGHDHIKRDYSRYKTTSMSTTTAMTSNKTMKRDNSNFHFEEIYIWR